MRGPNAIDFWRGYALACIYLDHLPNNFFASLTVRNFAVSSAAELFVFLAGWSLSLATGGPLQPDKPARIFLRISSRMVILYVTQLALTAIALATLATAALGFGDNNFLNLLRAGPVFDHPAKFTLGWVTLSYQLGYFDILPLYVVLLAFATPMVFVARKNLAIAVAFSFTLYAVALVFKLNLPSWPGGGTWTFDPLCWQLLFMLGFAAGELAAIGRLAPLRTRLIWIAAPIAFLGAVVSLTGLSQASPQFFLFDSTYQAPARLLNFVALVVCFGGAFSVIHRHAPTLVTILCRLGRNSLAVFSVGSILIVVAGIIHTETTFGAIGWSISTAILGLGVLIFTAWCAEWHYRPREALKGLATDARALEGDRADQALEVMTMPRQQC